MNIPSANVENSVIGQVIAKFVAGDPAMFELMAEDIDFRIDHFRDDIDINWQHARSREALVTLVGRLGKEVFPRGTRALSVTGVELGDGWHLTSFHQQFFYGVRQEEVKSQTYILSHEADGLLDYFRETVTNVVKV
jgi:hypothetical protein